MYLILITTFHFFLSFLLQLYFLNLKKTHKSWSWARCESTKNRDGKHLIPSVVDRIFVLWAANIFVRSNKWLLEWIRLTSDRDHSSGLKHGERNTLQVRATMDPHRSLLWSDVRLTDVKIASLSSTSGVWRSLFYKVSMRYHLLEISSLKHWCYSSNISDMRYTYIIFIIYLSWIAKQAQYKIVPIYVYVLFFHPLIQQISIILIQRHIGA